MKIVLLAISLLQSAYLSPKPIFVTGSSRDVKMLHKALQGWTLGQNPCMKFVENPSPQTYTLKFRWQRHIPPFRQQTQEADMDLFGPDGTLLYSEHKAVPTYGAFHQGHPEKEMYPKLAEALGCSYSPKTISE
jgi:hypothetical protein